MLGLALTLSALASDWTYPGFVADPSSWPPRPQVIPAPPIPPAPPAPPPGGPTNPPAPPVIPVPPGQAVRYRMSDAAGQVWEHTDPALLRSFIIERNAELARSSLLYQPEIPRR